MINPKDIEEINIQMYLTRYCNLRCQHCYIPVEVREKLEYIPIKEIENKMIELKDYYLSLNKEVNFNFIGGEILSLDVNYLNELAEITQKLKNNKVIFSGISNLLIKNIKDYKNFLLQIERIGSSYDLSMKRFNKKSYELWKSNIKYCINLGLKPTINITISKNILGKSKEILEELVNLGIRSFNFSSYIGTRKEILNLMPRFHETSEFFIQVHKDILKIEKERKIKINYSPLNSMIESIKRNKFDEHSGCEIFTSLNIDKNMNVTLCDADIPETNGFSLIGNLNDKSVFNLLKSKEYNKVYFTQLKIEPMCITCKYKKQCYGSCRINSKLYNPELDKDCWGFKKWWEYIENNCL